MARLILTGVWLLLLDGIFFAPWWRGLGDPGDELIRNSVRLSLLYYAAAALLMMSLRPDEWDAASVRGKVARDAWSLAWLAYVIHVVFAMKFAHHWSHADAFEHTRERSGFGAGIYVSHLFSLVWTLDVLWWWLAPAGYARRSPWVDRLLHAFMAFIVFNGTVVFESGLIRWVGVVMFIVLAGAFLYRLLGERLPRSAY
jgi:hypothetical protein